MRVDWCVSSWFRIKNTHSRSPTLRVTYCSSVPSYGRVHVGARCGVGARIAPPFMEVTDASRLVCVVVVSYQEYSLTPTLRTPGLQMLVGWSRTLRTHIVYYTHNRYLALHVRERREKMKAVRPPSPAHARAPS